MSIRDVNLCAKLNKKPKPKPTPQQISLTNQS